MISRQVQLSAALLALSLGSAALADETGAAPRPATERGELEVTMRIIEDPEAIAADAVMRRISLPPAAARGGAEARPERATEGSESGREFGQEVSQRARELAEQAKEQREEFGRSRAEEMRPEPPEPPGPPPR
jgi:hypothetical protein